MPASSPARVPWLVPAPPERAEPGPAQWRQLYQEATDRLGDGMAARWLVEDASGGRWPGLLDEQATARTAGYFRSMLERRLGGEPLQYVLGHWAFRALDLMVNRHVLVPRPETEAVVDVALSEVDRGVPRYPLVADLGTGSGAIALAIACERPRAQVWATDISEAALSVASANLAGLGGQAVDRVHLVRGSWWDALPVDMQGQLDLVVSNPPYISQVELPGLPAEVRDFEPIGALVAGPDGLEALRVIIGEAREWLRPGAALVVEIAPQQCGPAQALAHEAGLCDVSVRPDLAGKARALVGRKPA